MTYITAITFFLAGLWAGILVMALLNMAKSNDDSNHPGSTS